MARRFHLKNGAIVFRENIETVTKSKALDKNKFFNEIRY
jgi:hypothetical protein